MHIQAVKHHIANMRENMFGISYLYITQYMTNTYQYQTNDHTQAYIYTELPLRHTIIINNIYSTVVHIRIPYATYFLRLLRVFKNNLITTLRSLAKGLTFSGLHSSMVSLASILPLPLVGGRSLHSSSLPMGEVDMFKPMLIYECFVLFVARKFFRVPENPNFVINFTCGIANCSFVVFLLSTWCSVIHST